MAVRRACPLWRQETGRSLGVGSKRSPVGGQLWSKTDQHWPAHQGDRVQREHQLSYTYLPDQHSSSSNQEPEVNKLGAKRNGGSTQLLCGQGEQFP